MPDHGIPRECLEGLTQFDTCTLSNAIERLQVRPRNEGFVIGSIHCQFPKLPPVAGYAVTGRIRSSMPPVSGARYYEQIDWWRYLASVPAPRIVVLQDADPWPGTGALFGEVHARICRALDCKAFVTNGAVRDLPDIEPLGFQLFAGCVSVSHAYAHVVEFGEVVEIGGLRISSGDILHADLHGVQSVPPNIVGTLPAAAEEVRRQEEELFQMCEDKNFNVDMLAAKLQELRVRKV